MIFRAILLLSAIQSSSFSLSSIRIKKILIPIDQRLMQKEKKKKKGIKFPRASSPNKNGRKK